jgi:hypothetical protein
VSTRADPARIRELEAWHARWEAAQECEITGHDFPPDEDRFVIQDWAGTVLRGIGCRRCGAAAPADST